MNRNDQLQERMGRLRWACRRTRMELDEPLGHFLENHYAELSMPQQFAFERLISSKDIEISEWLEGLVKANDPGISEIVGMVRQSQFAAEQRLFADEEVLSNSSSGDINSEAVYTFLDKDNPEILEELKQETLSSKTVFTNLGLLHDEMMTLAGNLLFGKLTQRFSPSFYLDCVHFPGDSIAADHFIDKMTVKGTLRTQYDGAMAFLRSNLRHIPLDDNFNAQTALEVDERILGELVVNALIHRDYYIQSSIKVFIFADRIEIISPGKLPNSLTIEKIKNGLSVHRNPVLNSISKSLLPYSGYGSGVKRVLRLNAAVELVNDLERELFICRIPRQQP